jgi:hypothetical protein
MNKTILKTLSFFTILSFSLNLKAQTNVFEINASALLEDKITNNYSVLVLLDGQIKDSIFCKKAKPIVLTLEGNKIYSIIIKKENYPEKYVIVNTKNPSGVSGLSEEAFNLQIELSPTLTTVKQELIDYPVAILMINKKVKSLMASEKYYQFTHN